MADPITVSTVVGVGKALIERIWPDPSEQAEQLHRLAELEQKGDLAELNAYVQLLNGQLSVNLKEAEHPSLWVSGWRPAVGWTACAALFCAYVPKAIVITSVWTYQVVAMISDTPNMTAFVLPDFPDLGIGDLIGLLGSMLGIGIMRSIDKFNRVDTKRHK